MKLNAVNLAIFFAAGGFSLGEALSGHLLTAVCLMSGVSLSILLDKTQVKN